MAQPATVLLGQWSWTQNALVAHPSANTNAILNLNDGVTFTLLDTSGMGDGLNIDTPKPEVLTSSNPRTVGERVTRRNYRSNRRIRLRLDWSGKNGTFATWIAALHTLAGILEGITPENPGCLQLQLSGSSTTLYADVLEAHAVSMDYRELMWVQLLDSFEVEFVCRPFLRGSLQRCSNLSLNPGFEAPMGGGITTSGVGAFADTFANTNAYSSSGGTPTVAANLMTIPVGCTSVFGSSSWGAIYQWTIRFQASTSMNYDFQPHRTNASNVLRINVTLSQFQIVHTVGGGNHILQTTTPTLTAGTFYWLTFTQFPAPTGTAPMVQAALYNDSAGSIGTAVTSGSVGPVQTFDAVTALSGKPALVCFGGTMKVGGAFASVHVMQLFGPGGWYANFAGASGSWEGTRTDTGMSGVATAGTQTYGGGPVTSYGSARLDLYPAGTCNSYWANYDFSTIANTIKTASPGLGGQVMQASAYVLSSGVANSCSQYLVLSEFDLSGNFLRSTTLASVTGAQASWTKLSGTVTLGVQTNFVSLLCQVTDNTSASVNGTVWFDNVQSWNQTTTSQSSMNYHELRFPNSPAQLVVSGLLGDVSAPAYLGFASYVGSWGPGASMPFVLGRAAHFQDNASPTAALTGRMHFPGGIGVPILDGTAFGGFYSTSPNNTYGVQTWDGVVVGGLQQVAAVAGTYHLYTRARSTQSTGNIGNVTVDAAAYDGAFQAESLQRAPFSAGSTWGVLDAGLLSFPVTPYGALTGNPGGNTNAMPRTVWRDSTGGGSGIWENWWSLVPTDGTILTGVLNNPTGNGSTATTSWNWVYVDPLAAFFGGGVGAGYAWRLFAGGTISQSPQTGVGGPGTTTGNFINVNTTSDPFLVLDPITSSGVNVIAGHITDGNATVMAMVTEIAYVPLYVLPQ